MSESAAVNWAVYPTDQGTPAPILRYGTASDAAHAAIQAGANEAVLITATPAPDNKFKVDLSQSTPALVAFTPPAPTPTPLSIFAAALAAGLAITSTATPALNATYALDTLSQQQISEIGVPLFAGAGFPDGNSTFMYPDATGMPHSFAIADFKNLYQAVRLYIYTLNTTLQILSAGGSADWPPAAATIA